MTSSMRVGRGDTHGIEPQAAQRNKAHKIAKCIGECQDFGCQAALGLWPGFKSPFCALSLRWTLTIPYPVHPNRLEKSMKTSALSQAG